MHKNTENINVTKRRIEKACEYVSDLWFPVNSELLAKIKLGVRGGVYDLDPESLITAVSSDFSLYMYCLRELLQMMKKEGISTPPLANPIEVLRQGGLERLKTILTVEEKTISKHSFEAIDEHQTLRLTETMVSASAAQTLAESFQIDEETGYSAALLRQLGHTLIAWNYPGVYKDALVHVDRENSLDTLIAEQLGFSPTLLAIRLLVSWGIPVEFCEAVFLFDDEETEENEETVIHNILGGTLSKLCCVGEALARANQPEIYPNAKFDWEVAQNEIKNRLGKDGILHIQEALYDNLENYLTFMPELFNGALILDPELHLAEHERDIISARNPYISLCDPTLKGKLSALYINLPQGVISERSINELVKNIIPLAKFSGGYIYSVDPGISMLVPQTRFGKAHLKEAKAVDYSLVVSEGDSVSVAFRSSEPVIEYGLSNEQELIVGITGLIGQSNRVGVLYLEVPQSVYSENERAKLNEFKAFTRTITDCLNLR